MYPVVCVYVDWLSDLKNIHTVSLLIALR